MTRRVVVVGGIDSLLEYNMRRLSSQVSDTHSLSSRNAIPCGDELFLSRSKSKAASGVQLDCRYGLSPDEDICKLVATDEEEKRVSFRIRQQHVSSSIHN